MDRLGFNASLRASFGVYSQKWEIDQLMLGLKRAIRLFK
jgi:selenocysteine lyase/cysteine desulfurase